jgi:hypothetical protein
LIIKHEEDDKYFNTFTKDSKENDNEAKINIRAPPNFLV